MLGGGIGFKNVTMAIMDISFQMLMESHFANGVKYLLSIDMVEKRNAVSMQSVMLITKSTFWP